MTTKFCSSLRKDRSSCCVVNKRFLSLSRQKSTSHGALAAQIKASSCGRSRQWNSGDLSINMRLEAIVPDFKAQSTVGPIEFHKWKGDSWVQKNNILLLSPNVIMLKFISICNNAVSSTRVRPRFIFGMPGSMLSSSGLKSHPFRIISIVKITFDINLLISLFIKLTHSACSNNLSLFRCRDLKVIGKSMKLYNSERFTTNYYCIISSPIIYSILSQGIL